MEKEQNRLNQSLSHKTDQEVLEISSTGYGLESVSKETEDNSQKNKNNRSSCGGL
ncbi:hypothetical protein JMM81_14950 [Bacillus sp. V3B]|uniref:hypothetical protein n=1 Tax=Bacillus sp. V3B TaxID=2804915 RepID=UPI00210D8658|nr:hypothetical protein [Bacillus sp. V3B]MCQ6276224.1 hypothetical protein [Bacillus sp. V3B]